MPAVPAAPAGGAAKTMFGYAAPVLPKQGAPAAGGPPPPGPRTPAATPPPATAPTPMAPPPAAPPPAAAPLPQAKPNATIMGQGLMMPPPQAPGFGGPPPAQPPPGQFGGPPPGPPQGYPGGPPPGQFGGPPPGPPPGQFGGPPPGPPPGQFGGPPPGPPPGQFGGSPPGPPPGQFGGPPPGPPPGQFGGPPPGGPPPGYAGGPPPGAAPTGAPPQAYPGGNPFAAPQQDLPGPIDDWARKLPQSQAGTLFGIPLATLRDLKIQKSLMFIAGIALAASVFVPYSISPTSFSWDEADRAKGVFTMPLVQFVIFPLLMGVLYLGLTAAPRETLKGIPEGELAWIPFGTSLLGVMFMKAGGWSMIITSMHAPLGGGTGKSLLDFAWMYSLGWAVLCFGLLARLTRPQDKVARWIILAGVVMLLPVFFNSFGVFFSFKAGVLWGITHILYFLVSLLAILCIAFVLPTEQVPALKALDAFTPHVTAVLLLWLPLHTVLIFLAGVVHDGRFLSQVLTFAHLLLPIVAFFGLLMVTAPAAYDDLMASAPKRSDFQFGGGGPQPPPGGYPPPGGGYPPPGGGYPPQGGGAPPGGGWPPPQ